MSFRQYGGINYAAKNNIVKNNFTNANNLSIMTKVGQPDSLINVESTLNVYAINLTSSTFTTNENGVVPKNYVDAVTSGLKPKAASQCATTGPLNGDVNPTIGFYTSLEIDTYIVLTGNRVLIKNQEDTTPASPSYQGSVYNGIYIYTIDIAGQGTFQRALDYAYDSDAYGALTLVQNGTVNGNKSFVQLLEGKVGIDPLFFTQFTASFGLGQGLEKISASSATIVQMRNDLSTISSTDSSPFITKLAVTGATTLNNATITALTVNSGLSSLGTTTLTGATTLAGATTLSGTSTHTGVSWFTNNFLVSTNSSGTAPTLRLATTASQTFIQAGATNTSGSSADIVFSNAYGTQNWAIMSSAGLSVQSGTISGNGSGLTSVNASTLTTTAITNTSTTYYLPYVDNASTGARQYFSNSNISYNLGSNTLTVPGLAVSNNLSVTGTMNGNGSGLTNVNASMLNTTAIADSSTYYLTSVKTTTSGPQSYYSTSSINYNPATTTLSVSNNLTVTGVTDVNGNLNLRKPTSGSGGGLRFFDVTSSTSGYSGQIYDSGTAVALNNLNSNGLIYLGTTDGIGNLINALTLSSSNLTITTTNCPTISGFPLPGTGDTSSRIATTEWVQNVIQSAPTTSNWTSNSGNLYPNNPTATNVLVGTSANASNSRFLVSGTTYLIGSLRVDNDMTTLNAGLFVKGGTTINDGLSINNGATTINNLLSVGAGFQSEFNGGITVPAGKSADLLGNNNIFGYVSNVTLSSYAYAQLASPGLTGTPTAPTAAAGTNSTQIATTSFVQREVGRASYYVKGLAGNSNFPSPLPTLCITGFSSFDYFDPIIIRLSVSYQQNELTFNAGAYYQVFSSVFFSVFPKAFQNQSGQTIFYLNNGILSSAANTSYTYSNLTYIPQGRPTWANGIVNDNNICDLFPFTTSNDLTTAKMTFNVFSGLPTTRNCSINLEILNYGRFLPQNVYTTGFNLKNLNT
jgi:hypothetical protein